MLPKDIAGLIALYKLNALTAQETLTLEIWRRSNPAHEQAFNAALENPNWQQDLTVLDSLDAHNAFLKVTARIQATSQQARRLQSRKRFRYLAAAAAVLLVCGLALWIYQYSYPKALILPGGNKAVLTLAGGATIALSEGQQEIVISDSLIYGDGSGVEGMELASGESQMMEIATPKGGEYRIVLADQTKIILNAGSSIQFPRRFTGEQRIVELVGEAYFEVSHKVLPNKKAQAFIVKTPRQTVHVLGTHFNISAYPEQRETQTTLVEGAVGVTTDFNAKNMLLLSPGQQAFNKQGEHIQMRTVDTFNYIAWTKNQFVFNAEPLASVMQKIARWYDLDYEFRKKTAQAEVVEGILPRYASVEDLLELLQESRNIKFKVEGRKIIIY